jgi:hypothetical protein
MYRADAVWAQGIYVQRLEGELVVLAPLLGLGVGAAGTDVGGLTDVALWGAMRYWFPAQPQAGSVWDCFLEGHLVLGCPEN